MSLAEPSALPRAVDADAPIVSPLVLKALLLALAGLFIAKALHFFGIGQIHAAKKLLDFDAFHVAGQLVWRGEIAKAYSYLSMEALERQLGHGDGFLPWTYPPPFNLVVAPLGLLPLGLAYMLFTGGTLLMFLVVVRRIAGRDFPVVLLAVFPALAINISCGQNGFLTGALIGLSALMMGEARALAGLPLGAMIIKPHMAVPFALLALGRRFWGVIAVGALTVAVASAAATLAFGTGIWSAFLAGVEEAKTFLAVGQYPLYRMISVYALAHSLGAPALAAMLAQVVVAGLALAFVAEMLRQGAPLRQALGFAALVSPLISPYAYDYDLTISGVGLALLWAELAARTERGEQIRLMVLSALATGTGMLLNLKHEIVFGQAKVDPSDLPPSLSFLMLAPLAVLVWRTLQRPPLDA
jgi:hypothetical protein